MPQSMLVEWVAGVPASLPEEMRPMAESICQSFQTVAKRLMDLGLGYLSADWLIEMGPQAGANGGQVVAQGTIPEIAGSPSSVTGQYLR